MMADYIKREDAINVYNQRIVRYGLADFESVLNQIPAADVRENVRGEWMGEADGYADGSLVYDMWYCPRCGYRHDDDEPPEWNFCPNCGANMRGEKDD